MQLRDKLFNRRLTPVVICLRSKTEQPLTQVKDSHILTLSDGTNNLYLSANYRTLVKYKSNLPEGLTAGPVQSTQKFIQTIFNQ